MNSNSTIYSRIQKLAKPLWVGKETLLYDRNVYAHLLDENGNEVMKINLTADKKPENITVDDIFNAAKKAIDFSKRCENPKLNEKDNGMFASGPIPCNNWQHGVFCYAMSGVTKDCINRKYNDALVAKAKESILSVNTTTKTTCPKQKESQFQTAIKEELKKHEIPVHKIETPKKADKNDPMRIIVVVKYSGSEKKYSFRCRKWHCPGEHVCVHTSDEYKNVEVIECKTMKESEVKELAKSIGYNDISEVYCDEPIQLEREYHEDMNELNAYREAFGPQCDYAPANRDGYIYEEQDNYEPEDFDDLPD